MIIERLDRLDRLDLEHCSDRLSRRDTSSDDGRHVLHEARRLENQAAQLRGSTIHLRLVANWLTILFHALVTTLGLSHQAIEQVVIAPTVAYSRE